MGTLGAAVMCVFFAAAWVLGRAVRFVRRIPAALENGYERGLRS